MAERKATNKWIPADFDPQKHGSVNRYHKSHPLRDRARKIDQGILIIRFEMPFNVWCLHCQSHIGMGVRYNAEKKQIGRYLSTPVYEFRMKCHLCSGWMTIKTDPKNTEYVCVEGVRRKVETFQSQNEGDFLEVDGAEEKRKLQNDPFFKLEHDKKDSDVLVSNASRLDSLQNLSEKYWADDYSRSKQLRRGFRTEKKVVSMMNEQTRAFQDKFSLSVDLLPQNDEDGLVVAAIEFDPETTPSSKERVRKDISVEAVSIFQKSDDPLSKMEVLGMELKRRKILEQTYFPKDSALNNTESLVRRRRADESANAPKKVFEAPSSTSLPLSNLVQYSDSDQSDD